MEVYSVKPFGYCLGVLQAMELAKKAKALEDSPLYLLGLLVHNEDAVNELKELGLIPLDERDLPLEDHLRSLPDGSRVVFSAHGHPKSFEEIAKEKNLIVYDATCRYVEANLDYALKAIEQDQEVLYLGVKGHLESEAFLTNCPKARFYDVKTGIYDGAEISSTAPILVSQTTLSLLELTSCHEEILKKYPNARIGKERCDATSLRQQAISSLPENVDLVIVLGSKRSNNSLKLQELAAKNGLEALLCLNLEEVKALDLKGKKNVALASGASTSRATFLAVKSYLESL